MEWAVRTWDLFADVYGEERSLIDCLGLQHEAERGVIMPVPTIEIPEGTTYLEQVEHAAMSQLVATIQRGDLQGAKALVALMQALSIV